MSADKRTGPDELLLRDLVAGMSLPVCAPHVSVGIVGGATFAPQPPEHCLRTCLADNPETIASRGCAFLSAAARNDVNPAHLRGDRCPQGYRVAGQHTNLGGEAATLLTVEGALRGGVPQPDGANLLQHLDAAGRVVQRVGQILEENSGFADEVLQNYEQLNLIFDLTQQIVLVTDAIAIEDLLMRRVAHLLGAPAVCVFTHDNDVRVYPDGNVASDTVTPVSATDAAAAIDVVRNTRRVQVTLIGGRQAIAGPLIRLDDHVDVAVAVRRPNRGAFTSGDMMLMESVLAFGGQIISNSELHQRMRSMSLQVTRALVAAIDKKDHYTSGHSERGGFLTRLIAEEFGLSQTELQIMEWAGLLHDVGKIGIPEEILCKPGKLTPEEYEVIKQHPRMGYEILKPISSLGMVLDGVLYHHEHPDGSGYPEGLKGDQIPFVARIIHVADTFDALTSTRSYRQAFSVEKAFEIIRTERGTRIDTEVADVFFRAFERFCREQPEEYVRQFPNLHTPEEKHVGV